MIWLLFVLSLCYCSTDYISNGNFQFPPVVNTIHAVATNWTGTNFNLFNRSGFRETAGQYIDLKELTNSYSCLSQQIQIPQTGQYLLTFYLKNSDNYQTNQSVYVFWNSIQIFNIHWLNATAKFMKKTILAAKGTNSIRFQEIGSSVAGGYFLDQVSLRGPKLSYKVKCQSFVDYPRVLLYMKCYILASRSNDNHSRIFQNLAITVANEEIKYQAEVTSNLTAVISLLPQNINLVMNGLKVIAEQKVLNESCFCDDVCPAKFESVVQDFNTSLQQLEENSFNGIKEVYRFSTQIFHMIKMVYSISKTCIASYFLISLISFWNLSLMYNTLNIRTVPEYTRQFLEKLTLIFFNLNSIQEWTGVNLVKLAGIDTISYRQDMDDIRNQRLWFGSFGVSSKFLQNNIQSISVVAFSFLKLTALYFLSKKRMICKFIKRLPHGKQIVKMFLLQMVSIQTFIILSASVVIFRPAHLSITDKSNVAFQVIAAFISLATIYLYFLLSIDIQLQNQLNIYNQSGSGTIVQKPAKQTDQNREKLRRQAFIKQNSRTLHKTLFNEVCQFFTMLLIPFFIVFENPIIFLSVTVTFFFFRTFWFFRNSTFIRISIYQKIFTSIQSLLFLFLSLIYLSLSIIDNTSFLQIILNVDQQKIDSYCKICGIACIFIIIGGALIQLIRYLILIFVFGFKMLLKLCNTENRIASLQKTSKQLTTQQKADKTQKLKVKQAFKQVTNQQSTKRKMVEFHLPVKSKGKVKVKGKNGNSMFRNKIGKHAARSSKIGGSSNQNLSFWAQVQVRKGINKHSNS